MQYINLKSSKNTLDNFIINYILYHRDSIPLSRIHLAIKNNALKL